jgi:hypothetical protein
VTVPRTAAFTAACPLAGRQMTDMTNGDRCFLSAIDISQLFGLNLAQLRKQGDRQTLAVLAQV